MERADIDYLSNNYTQGMLECIKTRLYWHSDEILRFSSEYTHKIHSLPMEMKEGFATYYSIGDFIKNKKPLCTKNIICDIAIWNAMFEHIPLEIRENGKLVKHERCKHGVHSLLDPDNKEIFIRSMRGLGGIKVV